MGRLYKGLFFICVSLAAVIIFGTNVYAVDIFFEHRSTTQISRGVVYEENRMMTARGLLDVHVLLVDLFEPYITLGPAASEASLGRRETTSRLLADSGAIAGINADFFNTAGIYSIHFGPMVNDGQLLALNANTNRWGNEFATFFLDMNNNPFFRYMSAEMWVRINFTELVNVTAYNTIGSRLDYPMVVSRIGAECTSSVDARIPYVIKVVVENSIITYISAPGQTVYTPESGFVILIPEVHHETYAWLRVGQVATLDITSDIRVDFSRISAAIGGGGLILAGGETVFDGAVAPTGRHPRSAIGVTADGQAVFMTVDGRNHSAGATHSELADLLRHYGVVDAMHFDGGGSSTMVARSPDGTYSVVNSPSDGGQRRVVNAFGVFDNSPVGEMTGIVLEMAEERAIFGVPLAAHVFGVDEFGNRINLNFSDENEQRPVFLADINWGFWYQGRYTPTRVGDRQVEVRYGEFRATAMVYAHTLAELTPHQPSINLLQGGRSRLTFSGIAVDGSHVPVPAVTGLFVSPAYLGEFHHGYFHALRGGSGHIIAVVGTVRAYIPVTVGGFPWPVTLPTPDFMVYPIHYVSADVGYVDLDEDSWIYMYYNFTRSQTTQAAYVTFYPPISLPGEPIALQLEVYGDGSGHWLRARVRDGAGDFHNIDFARHADFIGWNQVTAMLPATEGPFTLDRIYMVTLGSYEDSANLVIFRNLETLYAPTLVASVPQGTVFTDRLRADRGFDGVPGGNSFVFEVPVLGNAEYTRRGAGNFAVLTLTARGGGLAAGDREQWRQFIPDINALDTPYVVLLIDENPLEFRQRMEFELFHLALAELRSQGRIIFVVSATGDEYSETTLTMRDGVRYINLVRPEEGNASIRFWTDRDRIWWSD